MSFSNSFLFIEDALGCQSADGTGLQARVVLGTSTTYAARVEKRVVLHTWQNSQSWHYCNVPQKVRDWRQVKEPRRDRLRW